MPLQNSKAFVYFLLSCLLLLPQAKIACDSSIVEPPAAIGDVFYMVRYHDGTSKLLKNLSDHEVHKYSKKHDVKEVIKTSFAELWALVSQRVSDYMYYFEQFVNTERSANPIGWKLALDKLMDVFSKDLTLYVDYSNFDFEVTSWGQVRDVFIGYNELFQGWTLQAAPNVRLIPLCNSHEAQAYVSAAQLGWERVTYGVPGVFPFANNVGVYFFTLRYEKDNVWRIITANSDNRLAYIFAPPFVYGPEPGIPYAEDPKSGCCEECESSSSESSSDE